MNIREIKFNDYEKISELVYNNNLYIYKNLYINRKVIGNC